MWNGISCTKLQPPPEPLTRELPPTDPRSLCPLSSTEFVQPPPPPPTPEQNSWIRHCPTHNPIYHLAPNIAILLYKSHLPWSVSEPLPINMPYIDSFDLRTYSHKTYPTWKYRLSILIAAISERASHYCRQATYLATRRRYDGMQGKYGYIWSAFVSFVCCCLRLLMLLPWVWCKQGKLHLFHAAVSESRIPTRLCVADRPWRRHLVSKLTLLRDSLILRKKKVSEPN